MTEGQHTGEAQEKIHRHGGQPKDENAGAERGVAAERRHPIGREHQGRPDTNEHGQLAGGVILDHVIMPSSPSNVPVRLPTPPTMMAMKLGIRSPAPMVGSRPS